jgi:hypothetical protein
MNKIQKLVAEFERKNGAIDRKISNELIASIKENDSTNTIALKIDRIYKKHNVKQQKYNLLAEYLAKSVQIGAEGATAPIKSIRLWYLNNAYSAADVPIKTTIRGAVDILEVKRDITESMRLTRSWREAAQNLSDKDILISDVAGDVQKIIDKARGVYGLTDDSEAYLEYKKEIAVVQRRINRLTDQDTSKLRRAYQDILDITNKSSARQVDNAIRYASYFKQRYNAERIARTEMARAYGDATFTDAIYNDEMIGVQFTLSSGHEVFDICDVHCGADLYGMGEGIYPKTQAPEYPFHPHCLCNARQVMVGETKAAKPSDYDPRQVKKYIADLSEDEQKKLLGVKGVEAFNKNPNSWSKNLRNWNGQEKKEPTIPKKLLYERE